MIDYVFLIYFIGTPIAQEQLIRSGRTKVLNSPLRRFSATNASRAICKNIRRKDPDAFRVMEVINLL